MPFGISHTTITPNWQGVEPFQQDVFKSCIEEVVERLKEKIQSIIVPNFKDDYLLEKLITLFDENVGKPYDVEILKKIHEEGEVRYKEKKPPCFMDEKKGNNKQYGDLILWKQILDFAKEKSCSIVFVTNEKKEDWWDKRGGERISPHLELRREFKEYTNQLFWMYSPESFLERAQEIIKIDIDPRSIEESNIVAEAETAEEQSYELLTQALDYSSTVEEAMKKLMYPSAAEEAMKKLMYPSVAEEAMKKLMYHRRLKKQ